MANLRMENWFNVWSKVRNNYSIQIIIPVLNELNNLKELLPRLQNACSVAPISIIVVDAKLHEEVQNFCQQFHSVQYVVSPKKWRSNQMNYAASLSKADVLYFVHADTRPPLSFYEDIRNALDEGFTHGSYRFKFDTRKKILSINSWFTRFKKLTFCGGDQTIFVPRILFEESGRFPSDYIVMEEYEWLKEMRASGSKFIKMDKEVLVSDRKYDHNSWLKVNIANFLVFQLYFKGWNQEKLIQLYKSWIKHPTL